MSFGGSSFYFRRKWRQFCLYFWRSFCRRQHQQQSRTRRPFYSNNRDIKVHGKEEKSIAYAEVKRRSSLTDWVTCSFCGMTELCTSAFFLREVFCFYKPTHKQLARISRRNMIRAVDVGCFDDDSSAVAHFAIELAPVLRKHFRGARLIELSFDVSSAAGWITGLKCLIDKSLFFDHLKIKASQSYRGSRRQLEQLRC